MKSSIMIYLPYEIKNNNNLKESTILLNAYSINNLKIMNKPRV